MRSSWTEGQHSFAQVPSVQIQRSVFDRSCGLKTTFAAGYLVPIFVDEALPGDTFTMRASSFGRLSTLLHPVMENIHLDYFFFSIPIRLVWNNFQKFMGEQANPGDSTDFLVPIMDTTQVNYSIGSLHDYLGLPVADADAEALEYEHSSLWHRGYNLVWNEWFRDENLQDSVVVDKDDGPDDPDDYVLLRRGKRHDYFTSCLPFPQKGTAVELPLGSTAPVVGINDTSPKFNVIGNATARTLGGNAANSSPVWTEGNAPATGAMEWHTTALVANLASATAATINDIREAFQVQRLFERDARGGTRYTEVLRSHFGVISPDQRLQRPEYLGGGTSRVNVNPVAATNSSASVDIGELGGFGTTSGMGIGFRKSFTEHCLILGLVAARADLSYQQGLHRMFSRRTRFDFYWPSLAHLGEQAVLNKEIQQKGADPNDLENNEGVFGYQERYAEYRYKPSMITGQMRSNGGAPLDSWHLAQEFAGAGTLGMRVALNEEFIVENPPYDRILAVNQSLAPAFLLDMYFEYKCARPMPVFSVPGMIDHF